jgi:hypothetical protein
MYDPEKSNSPWSHEAGFRATLTRRGYEEAREDATPDLDIADFVTESSEDLVVITLPDGGYHTVGGVRFMVRALFSKHGILQDDVTPGNVFDVNYDGAVMIEGLNAGEQWLNWSYNPDGTSRA